MIEIFAISILILIFSIVLHEVMHGYVAMLFGDYTAERAGRLTLNPIPHIDPIGTILVPLLLISFSLLSGTSGFLIGWAKPVPVNPLNFSNIRKGELFVSLAGIASNLALALIATVFYHLTVNFYPNFIIERSLQFAVSINLMLGIFNLIPIPPLDGANALLSQLPYKAAKEFEKISNYGFIILIALMYFNVISLIMNLTVYPLQKLLGVPFL